MLTSLFKDANFSPPPHVYLTLEVYWFGQCLGKRFSPISTFFSLVSSRAFRDAPDSRFWCRDLKLGKLDFFKMLDLTLSQIYTRVLHLWKADALNNAWVKDSRPFISFFTRVFSQISLESLGLSSWKLNQSWLKWRVRRFEKGPKLASSKSPVSIVWDVDTEITRMAHL